MSTWFPSITTCTFLSSDKRAVIKESGSSLSVHSLWLLCTLLLTPSYPLWGWRAPISLPSSGWSGFSGWLQFLSLMGWWPLGASVSPECVGRISTCKHAPVKVRDWPGIGQVPEEFWACSSTGGLSESVFNMIISEDSQGTLYTPYTFVSGESLWPWWFQVMQYSARPISLDPCTR